MNNNILQNNEKQQKYGNRCFHNKTSPRSFDPPVSNKKRPYPLELFKKNIETSYYYPLAFDGGKLYYRRSTVNKNGLFRKMRSEQRDVISGQIGKLLGHYTCLKRGILGYINKKTGLFEEKGIEFIVGKLGISKERVRSALNKFEKELYISIKENKKLMPDGSYKSTYATIYVNPQLYYDFGVSKEEFEKYAYSQDQKESSVLLQHKVKTFNYNKRVVKKEIKAFKKKIAEKDENSGSERKRQSAPLYRDYTGISKSDNQDRKSQYEVKSAKAILENLINLNKDPPH